MEVARADQVALWHRFEQVHSAILGRVDVVLILLVDKDLNHLIEDREVTSTHLGECFWRHIEEREVLTDLQDLGQAWKQLFILQNSMSLQRKISVWQWLAHKQTGKVDDVALALRAELAVNKELVED